MGGSASKGARQLPKSVPSAVRSAPEWAKTSGLPTEQPLPDRSAAPPFSPSSSSSASGSASRTPTRDDHRPDGSRSQSQRQDMLSHGRMESGSSMSREHQSGRQVGRAHANFSGDKDDGEFDRSVVSESWSWSWSFSYTFLLSSCSLYPLVPPTYFSFCLSLTITPSSARPI